MYKKYLVQSKDKLQKKQLASKCPLYYNIYLIFVLCDLQYQNGMSW